MIRRYRVIRELHQQVLEDKVCALIAEGWAPLGGIAVDSGVYYQALTYSGG